MVRRLPLSQYAIQFEIRQVCIIVQIFISCYLSLSEMYFNIKSIRYSNSGEQSAHSTIAVIKRMDKEKS